MRETSLNQTFECSNLQSRNRRKSREEVQEVLLITT